MKQCNAIIAAPASTTSPWISGAMPYACRFLMAARAPQDGAGPVPVPYPARRRAGVVTA